MVDTILESNLIEYKKALYSAFKNGDVVVQNDDIVGYNYFGKFIPVNPVYDKILFNRHQKNNRIQKHIVYGLTHRKYAWFGTFTFNDTLIDKCDRTQRDAIKRVLKQYDIDYILNVDYGSKNERKHFHCLIFCDIDLKLYTTHEIKKSNGVFKPLWVKLKGYTGGFCSFEPIGRSRSDVDALKKYINKLSNHCIKDSTESSRIVYNFKAYQFDYSKSDKIFLYVSYDFLSTKEKEYYRRYNSIKNKIAYEDDLRSLGF